jgi:putative ABC transport system ATP-binding protein
MVTHDPTAAAWADRVIFLVDGRIDRDLTEPSSDDVIDVFRELGQ